jgi:hypothetical protein
VPISPCTTHVRPFALFLLRIVGNFKLRGSSGLQRRKVHANLTRLSAVLDLKLSDGHVKPLRYACVCVRYTAMLLACECVPISKVKWRGVVKEAAVVYFKILQWLIELKKSLSEDNQCPHNVSFIELLSISSDTLTTRAATLTEQTHSYNFGMRIAGGFKWFWLDRNGSNSLTWNKGKACVSCVPCLTRVPRESRVLNVPCVPCVSRVSCATCHVHHVCRVPFVSLACHVACHKCHVSFVTCFMSATCHLHHWCHVWRASRVSRESRFRAPSSPPGRSLEGVSSREVDTPKPPPQTEVTMQTPPERSAGVSAHRQCSFAAAASCCVFYLL